MKSTVFVIQLYTTCLITVDLAGCIIPVDVEQNYEKSRKFEKTVSYSSLFRWSNSKINEDLLDVTIHIVIKCCLILCITFYNFSKV